MNAKAVALIGTVLIFGSIIYFGLLGGALPEFKLPVFQEKKEKKITSPVQKKTRPQSKSKSSYKAQILDQFNGVEVYSNGKVRNVHGRNTTSDGYNLGLKYQCVEYVKRYYYEVFGHKMPNSYGHAKEFYEYGLGDGAFNAKRALYQYDNPSASLPQVHDLVVYGPASFNKFGHVGIVSKVSNNEVEVIAQNLGEGNGTRRTYPLINTNGRWYIQDEYIVGWLRK